MRDTTIVATDEAVVFVMQGKYLLFAFLSIGVLIGLTFGMILGVWLS